MILDGPGESINPYIPEEYERKLPESRVEGSPEKVGEEGVPRKGNQEEIRYSENALPDIMDWYAKKKAEEEAHFRATFSREDMISMGGRGDVPQEYADEFMDTNGQNYIVPKPQTGLEKEVVNEKSKRSQVASKGDVGNLWDVIKTPFTIVTSWRDIYEGYQRNLSNRMGVGDKILYSFFATATTAGSMFLDGLVFLEVSLQNPKAIPYAIGFAIATNAIDAYRNIKVAIENRPTRKLLQNSMTVDIAPGESRD